MKVITKKAKDIVKVCALFSLFLIPILHTAFSYSNLNVQSIGNSNIKKEENNKENVNLSGVNDWWNSSFRYRKEIRLDEPGFFDRINEPIDIYMTFDAGKCHKDTIRVVLYISDGNWVENIYQQWNTTMYNANFVKSCTITFLANVNKSDNKLYYIYYSDNTDGGKIQNPLSKYLALSDFSSQLVNSKLSVKTSEYELELESDNGVFNFTKGNTNFHSDNSLSPWSKNAILDNNIFYPDATYGGAIYSWLVVGPFDYFDPNWNHPVTDSNYHMDMTKQYIEGDNATGGDAHKRFLDESKQWAFKNFQGFATYTSNRGYMDLNAYFPGDPNRLCAYASTYIRSPVTLNSVYLKVGSDDGIRIWKDGVKIHDNHVLRGPSPDREAIGPFTFEAGVWYYFIVLIEENTGDWGFNFRFSNNMDLYPSNPGSDPDKITNLDIAMRPPLPVIQSITEELNGPLFSRYDISWQDSEDMKVWDTITLYNNYNLWKNERTLWWANDRVNTSFSVLNTLYKNEVSHFDSYFYDNSYKTSISDTDFIAENYTIIRDTDGSKNLISLGIFLSNIEKGNSYIELNTLKWAVNYDPISKIVNIRPGSETDLDNKGPHIYPEDIDYHIVITFWEYIDDNIGLLNDYVQASGNFSGIYNSLKNPLIVNKDIEEASFFDLTVNVKDHDGYSVEGVKVYVYNSSTLEEIASNFTDNLGAVTFQRLPSYNYTMNFTFFDDSEEFIVKSGVTVNLNQPRNITVLGLNLTSLNLNLVRESSSDKIIGANVEFWYVNASGVREYKIKSMSSDSQGNVLFIWKNVSQSVANISVNVNLLGAPRILNTTTYYLNYTFYHRINGEIRVLIDPYSTGLERLEPISSSINNLYCGDLINLTVRYYWINETTFLETNITNAVVSYSIKDSSTGLIEASGSFNDDVYPIGYYNQSINTGFLNLLSNRPYEILISAQKLGYAPQTTTIILNLRETWTNLTVDITSITVTWNESFVIKAYYSDTLNGDIGLTSSEVSYSVAGTLAGDLVEEISNPGWYNLSLNSAQFPHIGEYIMSITAYKEGYVFQEVFVNINISYISTSLIVNRISIECDWRENFSLTIYYNDTVNDQLLSEALVTYEALGTINPIKGDFQYYGNGNYSITLNTTLFLYTGFYYLRIEATKLNYESQSIEIPININAIATLINKSVGMYQSYNIPVGKAKVFRFNYTVAENGFGLADCSVFICEWESGDSLGSGVTSLEDMGNGLYELDFNTEHLQIGRYTLVVTIGETNYASRSAIIILNIIPRAFSFVLPSNKFSDDIISVVSGNLLEFSIELLDQTNNQSLTDSVVYITIMGVRYNFTNNGDGSYSISISDLPEAFFTSQQISATITAEKANFTTGEKQIFIVIEMTEIFPGFPMFYFLIIIIGVVAIVAALVAYRTIQRARIPTFVKKVREMKSNIKSNKSISESLLYPSKEEYIVKRVGEKWEMLGLSLADILGIERKKGKLLPETTELEGGGI